MPTGGPAVQARRGWVVPWDGAEFGAEQDEGLETRELTSSLELTGRTVWPPQGLSDAGGGRAAWEALWLVQGTSWVCGCPLRCHVGTCLHHSPPKQGLSQRHPAGRKSPQVPVVWGERTQSERQVLHQQQQGQPRGSQGGGLPWLPVVRPHLPFPSRQRVRSGSSAPAKRGLEHRWPVGELFTMRPLARG